MKVSIYPKKELPSGFIVPSLKFPNRILSNLPILKVKGKTFTTREMIIAFLTFLLMISSIFMSIKFEDQFYELHVARLASTWGYWTFIVALGLLSFKILFLALIFILYKKYKPIASITNERLPTCTVIVPAYNEGKLVYDTLMSLVKSDYPEEKLEILCVDDGSKDDTWDWMLKAKKKLGDRITLLKQSKNMGKRHALHRGFLQGVGEIFITVDSDSLVKNDTLRNMASPFVVNEKCGAVAGNVFVLNQEEGLIPKMLNVSFAFSFEFIRSAQSVFGSVLCTPGAISGYRKSVVLACLDEWVNQTFLGRKVDIGEDRAMTNMILKQGFEVLFQKNAEVYTNVPTKHKGLSKMFIRWERSNVRENIMLSKFAFQNFRKGPSKIITRLLLVNQWIKIIFAFPAFIVLIALAIKMPLLILCSILIGSFIFSSVSAFFYAKKRSLKNSVWAYTYSIFYTFSLFWITPYAILTANKSGWLTREIV